MSLHCGSDHFLHPPERCPSSAVSYHCRYRPSGLINTDNRCFLNAAIHFLFASETFRSYLQHLSVHGAATHETPLHAELIRALPYFTATDNAAVNAGAKGVDPTPPPPPAAPVNSALPMSSAAARRRRRRRQKAEDAAATTTAAATRASVSPSLCSRSPVHIPFTSALTAARLRVGLQHDAHEFIVRVFERLNDEAATVARARSDEIRRDDDADADWTEIGKRSKKLVVINNTAAATSTSASPLTELFAVRERSTVDVTSRAHSSVNVSAHFTLLLTLNADDNAAQNTLTKLIAAHFTAQRLDDYKGNQNVVRAIISNAVDLARIPRTLIVTFKRFAFDAANGAVRKIGTRVSFQATLRLHNDSAAVFTLVSVIVHHGDSAANGHYTTFARIFDSAERAENKSADDELWIQIDDTHVTAVSAATVYASPAYCLLYSQ